MWLSYDDVLSGSFNRHLKYIVTTSIVISLLIDAALVSFVRSRGRLGIEDSVQETVPLQKALINRQFIDPTENHFPQHRYNRSLGTIQYNQE